MERASQLAVNLYEFLNTSHWSTITRLNFILIKKALANHSHVERVHYTLLQYKNLDMTEICEAGLMIKIKDNRFPTTNVKLFKYIFICRNYVFITNF